MTSRRLTFQLTPLLDLLLIVIFAQFMEVRDTTTTQEVQSTETIARAEREFTQARSELNQLQSERLKAQAALAQLERELELLQSVANELSVGREDLEEKLAAARKQRDHVAGLMTEMFALPAEAVQELIRVRTQQDLRLTPEQVERLRNEVREYSQRNPQEAVRHLLTFEEMRKRCDIWELHVSGMGVTEFIAGDQSQRFRAETPDEFERKLFECYKTLPQPKSLVILLLSYGDVKASVYEAAMNGLPRAASRMREDQNGRSRFEYAVLGFNAATPTRPGER
jgi:hypothetical protein